MDADLVPGMQGVRETLLVRRLGLCEYEPTWRAMQTFTDERGPETPDELWLLEHPPIYTQGQAGHPEHILDAGGIPVIQIDRGGQVTYHGPGQIVVYILLDVRRAAFGVKRLVRLLEQSVIGLLAVYGIESAARPDAPGVYVDDAKIAAIGLRVRHGCSFHGMALNVAMDLEPFSRINPCGYPGLEVTQIVDMGGPAAIRLVEVDLSEQIAELLGRQVVFE